MAGILHRLLHATNEELELGSVLHFADFERSAVASYHYRAWRVVRVFDRLDGRRYVRLTALEDRTPTKVVLLDTLLAERFVVKPDEPDVPVAGDRRPVAPAAEPPLPLRSRRARAAVRRHRMSAAE